MCSNIPKVWQILMRLIETLNVNVLFLKSELVGWGYTTNQLNAQFFPHSLSPLSP